jgi:hypothetical protein
MRTFSTPILGIANLISATICAQVIAQMPQERNIPLKNWVAPLYWHPTHEGAAIQLDSLLSSSALVTQQLVFVGITPCRIADTRNAAGFAGSFGPPMLSKGSTRTFPMQSSGCSIPSTALGYSLNVTVIPPGYMGFITVFPTGQPRPSASTLNDYLGTVVANACIVPGGTNGSVDVYADDATDLVIDINGYYVQAAALTTAQANTAVGQDALTSNTTGAGNMASGFSALLNNTTGTGNTAAGYQALYGNTTGSNNIGIGALGGFNPTTGNYNIMIGSRGAFADDHIIRIGDVQGQTFIAGISGVNVNGVAVLVSSSGQLGVASSSRRFKEEIQDMGDATANLMRLRPVTFRYKKPFEDGSKPIQYGLIAEEVEQVYPELVARSSDGKIETVKYQVLDSMLLNEVQKQNATITAQKTEISNQQQKIESLEGRLARLESLLEQTTTRTALR